MCQLEGLLACGGLHAADSRLHAACWEYTLTRAPNAQHSRSAIAADPAPAQAHAAPHGARAVVGRPAGRRSGPSFPPGQGQHARLVHV